MQSVWKRVCIRHAGLSVSCAHLLPVPDWQQKYTVSWHEYHPYGSFLTKGFWVGTWTSPRTQEVPLRVCVCVIWQLWHITDWKGIPFVWDRSYCVTMMLFRKEMFQGGVDFKRQKARMYMFEVGCLLEFFLFVLLLFRFVFEVNFLLICITTTEQLVNTVSLQFCCIIVWIKIDSCVGIRF